MANQPSVKLFDLDRAAKFQKGRDTVYIVPGEIVCLTEFDDGEVWIEYGRDKSIPVKGTLQSVEDEINRALGATYAAHLAAAKSSGEQLQEIIRKVKESNNDEEELFRMNDFAIKEAN